MADSRDPHFSVSYTDDLTGADMPITGTKSIFNDYAVFYMSSVGGAYNRLYDIAGLDGVTPTNSRNPSAATIIDWSSEVRNPLAASTPYSFADFAYCKYYGHIPNNYMVTLRRFPVPMLDNLKVYDDTQPMPPLAQAVTFMGEEPGNKLSEFFKQALGLNWEQITAGVQDVDGNEKGYEASLGALFKKGGAGADALGKTLGKVLGYQNPKEYSAQAQAQTEYAKKLYTSEGPYANRVYGPVNVITQTYVRKQGLKHENEIVLNFHYTARSIGGINAKAAMLDLASNFFALTYNNAKFWGGAIRYFPQHPNVPFFGDQKAFYNGDVKKYMNSVTSGMGGMANAFTDQLSKFMQNPLGALKALGAGVGKLAMGGVAASDRPHILSFRSLLTGSPIGEWHLVIGNPMNPIAMVGNLIVTDAELELGDVLGSDDFPTEMKFSVKLRHGKPRDKGDLESMFNLGNGRMYYGINGDPNSASMFNSDIDTKHQQGATNAGLNSSKPDGNPVLTKQDTATLKAKTDTSAAASIWGGKYNPTSLNIARDWSDPQTNRSGGSSNI